MRIASLAALLLLVPAVLTAAGTAPEVVVREDDGLFTVSARFQVPSPPGAVLAVLTDYEGIPRLVPDVTRSVVRGRTVGHVVVEQEAVSRVLFFSRTVHLLLDVREAADSVVFTDVCGRSFREYAGHWRVRPRPEGGSVVLYDLRARPAFGAPSGVVIRLLRRDAGRLVEALRGAMAR